MNFKLLIIVLLTLSFQSLSQTIDADKLKNLKTRNIGPAGMSGRITCIDVVSNHQEQIYIGTASGGIWKSTNAGISWKPVFDKESTQSIGALKIQQNNSDVIWVGTGEGNPRNSHNSGNGIYKSIDGGKTWKNMGLMATRNIHRIIINKDNPDVVYVGAMGSAWGKSEDRGLYKTSDGGKSWKKILYANDLTGCADLIVSVKNPNKIIAAMYEHHRKPWTFTSGGKGSGLHISYDGGLTWKKKNGLKGLPKGIYGRIGLATASNKPDVLYALIESKKTGLYRSDNGGKSWKLQATKNIGNRPFYYADIFVDPTNENRIFNLWSFMTMSEDGGKTFSTVMPYSRYHPDHHAFWINPKNPLHLMDGNDGGLNISYDGGKSWRFVENLPLAQFYHVNIDLETPYNIYGGMQDNGSWKGPSSVWQRGGMRNSHWQELVFGDGFDVVPVLKNPSLGFAMYQGGNVFLYDDVTGKNRSIKPEHPKGAELRFNWNAAIAYDQKREVLYFGSQFVHKSKDKGMSWEIISPDLTTNDSGKQKQVESGGLTIDATQAENFTTILCIAPDPFDDKTIWASTDDGNLQITRNGGESWDNLISKLKGAPEGSWIPQIQVSQINKGEAFVVLNNYRRNDWNPYLYYTNNYGKTWKRIVEEGTCKTYVRSVLQDPTHENLLFMGTDRGLYVSIDKGNNWTHWTNDLPNCPISDMAFQKNENDLVISTFGRAIWIMDDIKPLQALSEKNDFLKDSIKLFAFNSVYDVSFKSANGVRFIGDAHYIGQNQRNAASAYIWVHPDLVKKDKKQVVIIEVFDKSHRKIRSMKRVWKKSGLKKVTWNMRSDGTRYPHNNALNDKEYLPAGNTVLPGDYLIKVNVKGKMDSAWVKVLPDPRRPYDLKQAQENIKNYNLFKQQSDKAYSDFKKILQAEKFINLSVKIISTDKDSLSKKLLKDANELKDSIKYLKDMYLLSSSFKGYDHVTIRINNKLGKAQNLIMSNNVLNGTNQIYALKNVELTISKATLKVDSFLNSSYKNYKILAINRMSNIFKDEK